MLVLTPLLQLIVLILITVPSLQDKLGSCLSNLLNRELDK